MAQKIPPINELAAKLEPEMRAAFLAAVQDIVDNAQVNRIAAALEAGNINEAIRLVGLDPAAFAPIQDVVRSAYQTGGQAAAASIPTLRDASGAKLIVRFDGRDTRAERLITEQAATAVTRIVSDQVEGLRTVMQAGLARGDNPRSTALDIVGRISRETGRREGGIVGLTAPQMQAVDRARMELRDPQAMVNYFTRTRRDARFDKIVRAAMKDGKPVASADIDRITARYADRLLKSRADTIARTETLGAIHKGKLEAFEQAIDKGQINRRDVRKVWRSAMDDKVRDSHAALNGESVGIDEYFANGLQAPCDPGGDPAEIINCRCDMEIRIDFLSNL